MGVEFFRGNNSRCPSFLVFGLMIMCLFLLCSWWSLSSQNFELLKQIDNIAEQLRVNGEEMEKCKQRKMLLEEKLEDSQNKFVQQQIKLDKAKETEDEMKENYEKVETELSEMKKKSESVDINLDMCHTEMESWKKVSESQNKTLETLLTEKVSLKSEIAQKEEKIKELEDKLSKLNSETNNGPKNKFPQPIVKVLESKLKTSQQKEEESDKQETKMNKEYTDQGQIEKGAGAEKSYGDASLPVFDDDVRQRAM